MKFNNDMEWTGHKHVTNTKKLIKMNDISIKNGFNRSMKKDMYKNLKSGGIHYSTIQFIHNHKAGVAVEPHFRTIWEVFTANDSRLPSPIKVIIDTPVEVFKANTAIIEDFSEECILKTIESLNEKEE